MKKQIQDHFKKVKFSIKNKLLVFFGTLIVLSSIIIFYAASNIFYEDKNNIVKELNAIVAGKTSIVINNIMGSLINKTVMLLKGAVAVHHYNDLFPEFNFVSLFNRNDFKKSIRLIQISRNLGINNIDLSQYMDQLSLLSDGKIFFIKNNLKDIWLAFSIDKNQIAIASLNSKFVLDPIYKSNSRLYSTYLVDLEGMMIAHSNKNNQLNTIKELKIFGTLQGNSENGSIVYQNSSGESMIAGFKKIKQSNIAIVTEIPEKIAFEAARKLNARLIFITLLALSMAIVISIYIAKKITKPIRNLIDASIEISKGHYNTYVNVQSNDEIAHLESAFNQMTSGLAERDRVRDLLGKCVSKSIAQQLMSRGIELGGEEREATILFLDLRNFTSFSENKSPKEVLSYLNIYLSKMTEILESHDGVVDKYIGDAIMGLFGVPISDKNDVDHALITAIEMVESLDELNYEFQSKGMKPIDIGIGINTDIVVAGNLGSKNRLNYTVIGDGVNLASRLESLTKETSYNTRIVVSKSTLIKARGDYKTRYLGEVAVKGKSIMTPIYALDGRGIQIAAA